MAAAAAQAAAEGDARSGQSVRPPRPDVCYGACACWQRRDPRLHASALELFGGTERPGTQPAAVPGSTRAAPTPEAHVHGLPVAANGSGVVHFHLAGAVSLEDGDTSPGRAGGGHAGNLPRAAGLPG